MENLEEFKLKSAEIRGIRYSDRLYRSLNKKIDRVMRGASLLRQLGNYGAILHKVCKPNDEIKVAIVIEPPHVYICPSDRKVDGVFIDYYRSEIYGECAVRLTKINDLENPTPDDTLHLYSDYYAKLDGWNFNAEMLHLAARIRKERLE